MDKETKVGTRLASMLVDHFAMTLIAMIFFIPEMISAFTTAFQISHEQPNANIFGGLSYVGLLGFALYLCKDSINGRSIAKRILKIQVLNDQTGEAASPVKCLIRNLFCLFWPIEVIITLASPSRRIGDMVVGTRVVPFDSTITQRKPDLKQIGISVVLAYGLMLLLMMPFNGLMSMMERKEVTFIETSINNSEAKEVIQLFETELGDQLRADVRVYDEIEETLNLKYVSVILTLNNNYLDDDYDFQQVKDRTLPILLSKYSEGTFVGQIKYVYKGPGSMITRTISLDWRED